MPYFNVDVWIDDSDIDKYIEEEDGKDKYLSEKYKTMLESMIYEVKYLQLHQEKTIVEVLEELEGRMK